MAAQREAASRSDHAIDNHRPAGTKSAMIADRPSREDIGSNASDAAHTQEDSH
jgi:hypothetical protein